MTLAADTEVVITADEYDVLRRIADAAQWMRDCRGVDGLDAQYEAALDATVLLVGCWEVLA